MSVTEYLFPTLDIILNICNGLRNRKITRELHQKQLKVNRDLQFEAILESRRSYILSSFNDIERHFQQMNSDLIHGSRELEKDMVDQRTLWCQTIILTSTIMILALITVLIQGRLPNANSNPPLVDDGVGYEADLAYSLTNAGSMAFLFLTIVIYIEIVHRISDFNVRRSREYSTLLTESMDEARVLLERIRSRTFYNDCDEPVRSGRSTNEETKDDGYVSLLANRTDAMRSTLFRQPLLRQGIANLDNDQVKQEFEYHGLEVEQFINERDGIIKRVAKIYGGTVNFGNFWEKDCEKMNRLGVIFFYTGSILMSGAVMIFMWCSFALTFLSIGSGWTAVTLITVSIIVSMGICFHFVGRDLYVTDTISTSAYMSSREDFLSDEGDFNMPPLEAPHIRRHRLDRSS